MTKPWSEVIKRSKPPQDDRVLVRFTMDCTHCGLPMTAGDDILVEPHWADRIEAIGSGHRITNHQQER